MNVTLKVLLCLLMYSCGTQDKISVTPDGFDKHEADTSPSPDRPPVAEPSPTATATSTATPTGPSEPKPAPTDNVTIVPDTRYPEPKILGKKIIFYATYYFLPVVENHSGPFALLAQNGSDLGVSLSRRIWCDAAMEGSIAIKDKEGVFATYNYVGMGGYSQVDCTPYYNHPASQRARFQKVDAPFGLGVNGFSLVPYRSIATSQAHIPTGTTLYVPSARGTIVTLPDGTKWEHDGYFLAADVGGKIETGHIDVFIGPTTKNPFSFVTSDSRDQQNAYIIEDKEVTAKLTLEHKKQLK